MGAEQWAPSRRSFAFGSVNAPASARNLSGIDRPAATKPNIWANSSWETHRDRRHPRQEPDLVPTAQLRCASAVHPRNLRSET
jgi:hypothetical protein